MNSTILIVDDLRPNLDHLGAVLTESGIRILEAESGTRALAIAQAIRPDAILIDIVMPEMNGIDLCRSLKAIPELAEIPILLITAHTAEEEQEVEAYEAGAIGVLIRPIPDAVLLARVNSAIRHAGRGQLVAESETKPDAACLVESIMSRDVARVRRNRPLQEVAQIMADRKHSCLLVCEEGRPIGIISERDMVGVLARIGNSGLSESLIAADVMSSPLVTVKERSTLGMANFKVSHHPIRRLPVVDEDGQLVGLVTQSDMVRALSKEVERRGSPGARDVTDRTAELEARIEELETGNRFKTEFLAHMSHEIRTPMTAVIGFAESLAESADVGSDVAEAADTILDSGQHILELINEILDLSKIEAGKLELDIRRTSPFEIAETVANLMRDRARDKELDFAVEYDGDLPEWFETDAMRLRQILINLTGNAIKFTDTGQIGLRLRYRAGDRPCLEFSVTDTGIGMSPDQQAKLFQPFTQAEASTAAQFGGTGLGLSISKQLAQSLGGDICVSSEAGAGTEFTVRINLQTTSNVSLVSYETYKSGAQSAETAAGPDSGELPQIPFKLLLVEDTRTNQIVIERVLRKAGAEVWVAANGLIATEMAREALENGDPYDVILMDTQMPVMDGREATRLLRSEGYDLPIVALTASAMVHDRQLCLDAGCNDVATKPIDRRKLITTIKTFADSKRRGERGTYKVVSEVDATKIDSSINEVTTKVEAPHRVEKVATAPVPTTSAAPSSPSGLGVVLSDLQQDMLREIFNLGLGVAAASLSEMTQEEVLIMVPKIAFVERAAVARILERELSSQLSAVRQDFSGSLDGEAVLVFAEEKILGLVSSVLGDDIPSDLTKELENDVLAEAGNIILGACLGTFADNLRLELDPSVSRVVQGNGSEVLESDTSSDRPVLLVGIDFRIESREISGFLSFILDLEATQLLISAVDAHIERLGIDF